MQTSKPSTPRLILNDDGSNFLYGSDELSAEDLRAYLSRLEGSQVDMVVYCVGFGGYVTYYESDIADPIGTGFALGEGVKQRRAARNRTRLRDEVGDYLGFVFSVLREMDIPAVASFRMNDAHMSSDPAGPVAGRFWMNHRQWCLGEPYGYYGSCLDYTVPQVREYLRRLVLEVIARFPDIAGVELDGMRSPFFFKQGEGREKAPIMTGFIRQVRADLDQAAADAGRDRYLLRINVPRCPELALETGFDVAAWDAEGLVDAISPGCYNVDFQPPIEEWKGLLSDRIQVHSYINCSPGAARYLSLEEYRGAAANAWGAGADGIYLFNYPCLDELSLLTPRPMDEATFPPPSFPAQCWHPDVNRSREAINELGGRDSLRRADKRYLYCVEPSTYRHYVQERAEIQRLASQPVDVRWRCYDDPTDGARLRLEVKLVGVTARDQFEFALNGETIDEARIQRLHSANGRDARVHPASLEPYSQYTIAVDPAALRRGDNDLTVTLTAADPYLFGLIEVRELEVTVGYAST